MTVVADKDLLLVGSIQLESPEQVLNAAAEAIGAFVPCLPDGETGLRSIWIGYLARDVYDGHPDIQTLRALDTRRPVDINGGENQWSFRLKPGARPHFDLGYAHFSLESYRLFSELKATGVIPEEVRFQVCIPSTGSGFMSYFQDPGDWPAMTVGYEDAVRRDVESILGEVPASELTIQYDVCVEVRDMQNVFPWSPPGRDKFGETIAAVKRLSDFVPDEALVGLHWCYGTLGGWPMVKIDSLELCTRLTNAAIQAIDRHVDYVHVPVLRHAEDRYFEPARELNLEGGTKVYLGLIHHTDGLQGFRSRMEQARRFMPADFGVASVCGYGRLSTEETLAALALHREIAADLIAARTYR